MSDDFDTFQDGGDGESLLVNLAEVEAQSFEVFPKSNYNLVVEECDYEISKSSGKPMWNMRFSIVDGPFANRKLFHYISFSEKALPMTKAALEVLAPELVETQFNPKKVAEEGTMIGRTATAKVGIQKGEGDYEDKNVIKSFVKNGGGSKDEFDI